MRLVVHGHNVAISADVHSHVEGRLQSALARFGKAVGRVTVRLHANVDAADAITTCHMLVELHPWGGLGVGETGPSPQTAIDRTAERLGVAVSRALSRRHALPPVHASAWSLE